MSVSLCYLYGFLTDTMRSLFRVTADLHPKVVVLHQEGTLTYVNPSIYVNLL